MPWPCSASRRRSGWRGSTRRGNEGSSVAAARDRAREPRGGGPGGGLPRGARGRLLPRRQRGQGFGAAARRTESPARGPRPAGRGKPEGGAHLRREADRDASRQGARSPAGGGPAERAQGGGARARAAAGSGTRSRARTRGREAGGGGGRHAAARPGAAPQPACAPGRGQCRPAFHGAARLFSEPGRGGGLRGAAARERALAPDRRGGDSGEGNVLSRQGGQLPRAGRGQPVPGRLAEGRALRRHRHARGRMMDVKRVEKPWGHEIWWAHTDRYVGKILFVKAGHQLSLQYHEKKDETVYLHRGSVILTVEEDGVLVEKRLFSGDAYHIRPGIRH